MRAQVNWWGAPAPIAPMLLILLHGIMSHESFEDRDVVGLHILCCHAKNINKIVNIL